MARGRVLLNLHYYENAILERVRLNEMIKIGIPIISEKPNPLDIESMDEYSDSIKFIDIIKDPSIQLVKIIKDYKKKYYEKEKLDKLEKTFKKSFKDYFSFE